MNHCDFTREILLKFCDEMWRSQRRCSECPLTGPVCRCGRGVHFGKNQGMSDEEIYDAYEILIDAGYVRDESFSRVFTTTEMSPVSDSELMEVLVR